MAWFTYSMLAAMSVMTMDAVACSAAMASLLSQPASSRGWLVSRTRSVTSVIRPWITGSTSSREGRTMRIASW
ncbi:hypothetical protein Y695_03579 [Hydrogenophaga sp. T4]|nr:hypothetical protein Y695_03579 [Hydrogenophaga sp. T4]